VLCCAVLQERAEVSRLRRALSEATAAGEREYLDLEEQLAEAERSRAAAAARAADLEARLEQQQQQQQPQSQQQPEQQQEEEVQQLRQQLEQQAAELQHLRQQQEQRFDVHDLQSLQQRVQEVRGGLPACCMACVLWVEPELPCWCVVSEKRACRLQSVDSNQSCNTCNITPTPTHPHTHTPTYIYTASSPVFTFIPPRITPTHT